MPLTTCPLFVADDLMTDEGFRGRPYKDTAGKWTIGYGRNTDDVPLTPTEAQVLLQNDINRAIQSLDTSLPWWSKLDDVRRGVLINMTFNLGIQGLLKFTNTLAAIKAGDYAKAASAMLESVWASQVGDRAHRLAEQMETGERT